MASQEDDVLHHLISDHAEGPSDLFGGEEEFEADGFEAEDGLETDGMEDSLEDSLETDTLDFESEDGLEAEDALEAEADALVPAIASTLNVESEDEFFGGLFNALKKAAPVVGRLARTVAPVLKAIPFPAAQVAGQIAGMAGQLAGEAAEAGEGEDGLLQRATEAAAEAAVVHRRAVPAVVGLVARQVTKNRPTPLPPEHRRQIVRQVNHAAKVLTRSGGPRAIRVLPKLIASINRTADARGTSVAGRLAVLKRSVNRIAQRPKLLRKLALPTQRGQRLGRMLRRRLAAPGRHAQGASTYDLNGRPRRTGFGGGDWGPYAGPGDGGGPRRITLDGPCTITITPL
jgi:hypothetical protein